MPRKYAGPLLPGQRSAYVKGLRRNIKRKQPPKTKQGLTRMIKNVALKQCETKKSLFQQENIQFNHNTTLYIAKLFATTQGLENPDGYNNSFQSQRVGDEIIARGAKFKFYLLNKQDRPNVHYHLYFFLYNTQLAPVTGLNDSQFWRGTDGAGGNMNRLVDTPNPERIKMIKTLKVGGNYTNAGAFNGKEKGHYREVWIPFNNRKIQYRKDGTNVPMGWDFGCAIVAYDQYSSGPLDNIASHAMSYCLYFKDP